MALDYILPRYLRDRIALLPADERRELIELLEELLRDPEPDGVTKHPAPLEIFAISPLPEGETEDG